MGEPLRSREQLVQEIERVKTALNKTKSVYLKREYTKHLWKMQKELRDYDDFHKGKRIIIVRCTDGKSRTKREIRRMAD